MSLERLLVPIYVPRWLHRAAIGIKRAFIPPARNDGGCQVTQAFTEQFSQFKEQSALDGRFEPKQTDWFPFLNDNTAETGFDPHYVLHTSWAARTLAKSKPKAHASFGDSLYFVGIASAFTAITFCDIRESRLPFRDIAIHLLHACFRACWVGAIWRQAGCEWRPQSGSGIGTGIGTGRAAADRSANGRTATGML